MTWRQWVVFIVFLGVGLGIVVPAWDRATRDWTLDQTVSSVIASGVLLGVWVTAGWWWSKRRTKPS